MGPPSIELSWRIELTDTPPIRSPFLFPGSLQTYDDLEHMLRAFILKIQVTDPLKEGCR